MEYSFLGGGGRSEELYIQNISLCNLQTHLLHSEVKSFQSAGKQIGTTDEHSAPKQDNLLYLSITSRLMALYP